MIHAEDCLTGMAKMGAGTIAAIVTDPPYGLDFMGKGWDHGVPGVPFWAAALRVAKPGAHLVAFGGTRMFHRLACGIEDAGWEMRDCLMWLYGQGFPKSKNIGGGFGTALKPAWEPIILARKPLGGTVDANVRKYGVGALDIDGCRIDGPKGTGQWGSSNEHCQKTRDKFNASPDGAEYRSEQHTAGRWPANVLLDEDAAAQLDAQTGILVSGKPSGVKAGGRGNAFGEYAGGIPVTGFGDGGGASRFFYCAKASRSEREAGLDSHVPGQIPLTRNVAQKAMENGTGNAYNRGVALVKNTHPTVKPVALMSWLVRLVSRPGQLVLDPFTGSGTTGVACAQEARAFVGFELTPEYVPIAEARIANAAAQALAELI